MIRYRTRALFCSAAALSAACASEIGTATCRFLEPVQHVEGPAADDPFLSIVGVLADRDGWIYVLDGAGRLVGVDPSFVPRWTAGSRGSGPGEFGSPGDLSWMGSDIAVWDQQHHRVSLWDRQGRFRGTIPLELPLPLYPVTVQVVDSTVWVAPALPPVRPETRPREVKGVVFRIDVAESTADTLVVFSDWTPALLTASTGRAIIAPPFRPFPSVVARHGRIYLTLGDRYSVEIFDRRGRRLDEITAIVPPPPVADHDRRRLQETLPGPGLIEQVDIPDHRETLQTVRATSDRGLFLRTGWGTESAVRWDRWDARGTLIESFLIPRTVDFLEVAGERIVSRSVDSLGVQRLSTLGSGQIAPCPGPTKRELNAPEA